MVTVLAVILSGFEVSPKPSSGVSYLKKIFFFFKKACTHLCPVFIKKALSPLAGARTKGGTLSHMINLPDVSVAMRTQ